MNYFNESMTQDVEVKNYFDKTSINTDTNSGCDSQMMMEGCPSMPIVECPQERVCHRYFCHEVPHVMPCNTRIINHHVYKHTFRPEYTCCEENVCENVFEPRCGF